MSDSLVCSDPTHALVLADAAHERSLALFEPGPGGKRRQKWAGHGVPKKGKRWGLLEDKPYKPLPYIELPVGLSEEEVDQFLREQRLEDLHRKLQLQQLEDMDPDIRAPSPPPIYDRSGQRLNTREMRVKKSMLAEYNRLIRYMIKAIPGYMPPLDWKPQRLVKKILIPVEKYPNAPFMGVIIGARGINHKHLQDVSGCRIFVRGKDVGDKFQTDEELYMPLHVHIEADTEEQINKAEELLTPLLNPETPEFEYARTHGTQQVALVNGFTLKKSEQRCGICGALGHLGFECPETDSYQYKMANVKCSICGDRGHVTSDCKIALEKHQRENVDWKAEAEKKAEMDSEFRKMMSELGVKSSGPSPVAAAGAAAARALAARTPSLQMLALPPPEPMPLAPPPEPQPLKPGVYTPTPPPARAPRGPARPGLGFQGRGGKGKGKGVQPTPLGGASPGSPPGDSPLAPVTFVRGGDQGTFAASPKAIAPDWQSQPDWAAAPVPRIPAPRRPPPRPRLPQVQHVVPPQGRAQPARPAPAPFLLPGYSEEVDESVSCPPDMCYRLQHDSWILADMGSECGAQLTLGRPQNSAALRSGHRCIRIVGDAAAVGRAKLHVRAWLDVHMSMSGPAAAAAPPAELLPHEGFPPVGFPPDGFPLAGFPPVGFPPELPVGFPPAGFPPELPAGFPPTGFPPDLPAGFPPGGFPPLFGELPPGMPPGFPGFPPGMPPFGMDSSEFHGMPQPAVLETGGWTPYPAGMSQEAFDEI